MIKQDKGESTRSGGMSLNMSELALLTIVMQEDICEATGMTAEAFDTDLAAGINTYRLARAGMDVKEALEVSGLKDKVSSVTEVDKDGTVTEIDVSN